MHRQLVEAIVGQDADRAVEAVHRYIQESKDVIAVEEGSGHERTKWYEANWVKAFALIELADHHRHRPYITDDAVTANVGRPTGRIDS